MTDNEIIKALDCFKEERCQGDECPYYREDISCNVMMKDVYDLVHRQNNTILFLKATISKNERAWLDAVIEQRNEAIKEFAERIKEKTKYMYSAFGIRHEIDDLVEKMTGEE